MSRCPTCGAFVFEPKRPKRICHLCKRPIVRHDKFYFDTESRVRHWDCNNPTAYPSIGPAEKDEEEI